MFARLSEVFGGRVTNDRALRLDLLTRVTGHPIETTRTFTEQQYRWTARRLAQIAECPDSAAELLRDALAATAPAIDPGTLTEAVRQDLTPAETVEQALALCDRAAEVGHELFYALGDAALVLIAAARGARKKDVLAEHLKEREHLKPLLCPDGEDGDPVTRWLILSHVAARIPLETREEFASVPFGYHKTAATVLMTKNGLRVPPDLREIERRLSAVADAEYVFKKPADLRDWIQTGSRTEADGSPVREDHPAAFRAAAATLGVTAAACDALLAAFHVRAKRGTR